MQSTRLVVLVLLVAFVPVTLPLLGQGKTREPVYQGQPLSALIKDLDPKEGLLKRIQALRALDDAGPEARPAIPALLATFAAEPELLHPLAARALSRIGSVGLAELRDALNAKQPQVRAGVALACGLMREEASPLVSALTTTLGDKESTVRALAARALAEVGNPARKALPELRKLLEDSDLSVRLAGVAALYKLDREVKSTLPILAKILSSADDEARRTAAEWLANNSLGSGAKTLAPALQGLLTTKDEGLRLVAARAHWRVAQDAKTVLPVYLEALKSSTPTVRQTAVAALGGMEGEELAVKTLVDLSKSSSAEWATGRREALAALVSAANLERLNPEVLGQGLEDKDLSVRWWAAVGLLARPGDPREREDDLIRTIRAVNQPPQGKDPPLSVLVTEVAEASQIRAAETLARSLATRRGHLQMEVARALGTLGASSQGQVPLLIERLKENDKLVRRALADALGRLGRESIPPLVRALGNGDARIREGAARALGVAGPRARVAVTPLRKLLRDEDSTVRTQAALALWYIENSPDLALPVLDLVFKDVDNKDRWEAIEGIGIIAVEARPPIKGLTEILVKALKDRDARVRVFATRALWRRTRQERVVIPLLRDVVTDGDALVRQTALEVFAELGEEAKVSLITPALEDRDAGVRFAGLSALEVLGPQFLPQLVAELGKASPRVRVGIITVLGWMGPKAKDALPELNKWTQDNNPLVRRAAMTAVGRIRPGS